MIESNQINKRVSRKSNHNRQLLATICGAYKLTKVVVYGIGADQCFTPL